MAIAHSTGRELLQTTQFNLVEMVKARAIGLKRTQAKEANCWARNQNVISMPRRSDECAKLSNASAQLLGVATRGGSPDDHTKRSLARDNGSLAGQSHPPGRANKQSQGGGQSCQALQLARPGEFDVKMALAMTRLKRKVIVSAKSVLR